MLEINPIEKPLKGNDFNSSCCKAACISNFIETGLDQKDGFAGHVHKKGLIFFLGYICAIFWGVGTQFMESTWIASYWYVTYSVSFGDLLFLVLLMLMLYDNVWRKRFQLALNNLRYFAISMFLLATILITSVVVNFPIYGGELNDIFACSRFFYFILIAVFINAYTKQYGLLSMLAPFSIGLFLIAVDKLYFAFTSSTAVILNGGIQMVSDPNVAGAVFGYGVVFCSLALLWGGRGIYLLLASIFVVASAFTFSKGSWVMVFLGLVACVAAIKLRKKTATHSNNKIFLSVFVVALTLPYIIYDNYQTLETVFTFKLESTEDIGSVGERYNLALVGLYAMAEHPLLGVGFRNFDVVGNQFSNLIPRGSGNANNAFLQIGAVGGVISFALIICLFVYPFKQLSRVIPLNKLAGKVYFMAIFLVMLIFSVVQLQLIAQPVFWVFIGLISGWQSILKVRTQQEQVIAL